jgi:hypothetical protein
MAGNRSRREVLHGVHIISATPRERK